MKYYSYLESPIGHLLLRSTGDSLCGLYMELADIDYTNIPPEKAGILPGSAGILPAS